MRVALDLVPAVLGLLILAALTVREVPDPGWLTAYDAFFVINVFLFMGSLLFVSGVLRIAALVVTVIFVIASARYTAAILVAGLLFLAYLLLSMRHVEQPDGRDPDQTVDTRFRLKLAVWATYPGFVLVWFLGWIG